MSLQSPNNHPAAIGKYQVLEIVKQVGELTYYKAKTHGVAGFEKSLILCLASPELSSDEVFVTNLLHESRKTVSLANANVAQVYDLGQDKATGRYFLAMEFVGGHTLGDVLKLAKRVGRPLPIDLAILIASEMAKGLDYAHRRKSYDFENLNVVHGDLSPSSVLLSSDGTTKITNFGIACAISATRLTRKTWSAQDIRYLAPEVVKSRVPTQAGDIFSLGLTFYEMLAGHSPYPLAPHDAMYKQVTRAAIPSLSKLGTFPREIVRIVESMLVPNPDGRIESAGAIFEELVGFIYSQSLRAEPRLISKFLSEIGLSKHRTSSNSGSQDGLAAFNLRRRAGRELEPAIRANVTFDPKSDTLPLWIEYPLRDIIHGPQSDDWETSFQVVLLVDQPEPHYESATDRWARLLEQHSSKGFAEFRASQAGDASDVEVVSLDGVVSLQTVFHANSSINPASDLCEQFLYPLAVLVNERTKTLDHDAHLFQTRLFALNLLYEHGLDSYTYELLYALWISGEQNGDINPHSLATAVSEAILFSIDLVCEKADKLAVVWFAHGIELVDSLSIMILAKLSVTAAKSPVFAILSTDDEARVIRTMARDQTFPERLHTITVDYLVKEDAELPRFGALDETSKELLLLLTMWDRPVNFEELLELTDLAAEPLMALLETLTSRQWLRRLQGDRWKVILPEALTYILDYFTTDAIASAAIRLRDWYAQYLIPPDGYRQSWQPMDVFWPKIHAVIGEPSEMIHASEFIGGALESFGLYGILSHFYFGIDEIIVDSQVNIPHYRNQCLIRNSRLKLFMLDVEAAQEQAYYLSYHADENQGDFVIGSVLLFHATASFLHDKLDRAQELFKQVAEVTSMPGSPRALAMALLFSGVTCMRSGDLVNAQRRHSASLSMLRYYGKDYFSPSDVAHILAYGVIINYSYMAPTIAQECLAELEVLVHQTGDPLGLCYLHFSRGIHYLALCMFDAAHASLLECCSISKVYMLRFNKIMALFALVHMSFMRRDFAAARKFLHRAGIVAQRAPESVLKLLEMDYRALVDLADPDFEIDREEMAMYLASAASRARKLNIENDLNRIKFISTFAPPEIVPPELLELPAPPTETFADQIRLFAF